MPRPSHWTDSDSRKSRNHSVGEGLPQAISYSATLSSRSGRIGFKTPQAREAIFLARIAITIRRTDSEWGYGSGITGGCVARITRRQRRAYYRFAETPINGRGGQSLRGRMYNSGP